jgi:hypothetical protein
MTVMLAKGNAGMCFRQGGDLVGFGGLGRKERGKWLVWAQLAADDAFWQGMDKCSSFVLPAAIHKSKMPDGLKLQAAGFGRGMTSAVSGSAKVWSGEEFGKSEDTGMDGWWVFV